MENLMQVSVGHPMLLLRKIGFVLLFLGCATGAIGYLAIFILRMNQLAQLTSIGQWIAAVGVTLVLIYFVARLFGFAPAKR